MPHLSPEQLVDAAEGRGAPDATAHAGTCDVCRASVEELRATLALAQADYAAEPSPSFWDHLSARVGAAVRAEAERRARRVSWLWRWVPMSALAAAVLVAALVIAPRHAGVNDGPPRIGRAAVSVDPPAVEADEPGTADDASWMLMRDLSQEMSADDAGLALPAGPGTADRALQHLSGAERAALVDIIREEIARGSARSVEPSGD